MTDRNSLRAVLREKFPRDHGQLLPALHYLQHEFGYLPDWGMEVVGWHLGIPASEVYGAATSYTELRIEKPAQHVLRVCTGLSCWLNGASSLMAGVPDKRRAPSRATGTDEHVTVEETACGFMCGVAPVVQWDGAWRGHATRASVEDLIREAGVR